MAPNLSPDTEAFLLSLASMLPVATCHISICKALGSMRSVFWMFISFAFIGAALSIYFTTSHRAYHSSEFITLASSYVLFSLIYMEAFSMLCRGFSLSILVLLKQKPGLNIDEIIKHYGGVGADALITKRLQSLHKIGLIKETENSIMFNNWAGVIVSRTSLCYKLIMKTGKGG